MKCLLPGILLASTYVAVLEAAPLAVVNPGFEDITGTTVFNEFTFGNLPGWSYYFSPTPVVGSGQGPDYWVGTLTPRILPAYDLVNYQFFPAGAYEGQRMGIAFNFNTVVGSGNEYGLQQTLTDTLQANTLYTLSVRIGNIASGYDQSDVFYNLNGFPGYRVDLMAGETLLTSDNNSLFSDGNFIPEGGWGLSTLTFQTGSNPLGLGQNLRIRLVNLNQVDPANPTAAAEVDFDAVSLTAVVIPEPASLGLLIVSGLLMLRRRRSL